MSNLYQRKNVAPEPWVLIVCKGYNQSTSHHQRTKNIIENLCSCVSFYVQTLRYIMIYDVTKISTFCNVIFQKKKPNNNDI